jgi:hypothetical protein
MEKQTEPSVQKKSISTFNLKLEMHNLQQLI